MTEKHTLAASEVPPEWCAVVREIVQREGRAMRGPADRAVIESRCLRTNVWRPLLLFSSATHFTTIADRDAVLKQITG